MKLEARRICPLIYLSFAITTSNAQVQKPVVMTDGPAAETNNKAASLMKKGKLDEALKLVDKASLKDMGSPVPWVNGALIQYEMGRFARATRSSQEAELMGDRSIRRLTVDAEIMTAKRQFDRAFKGIERGEFQQPEDPYVHVARAKWADQTARPRVAERSRWQAARNGREAFLDAKEYSKSGFKGSAGLESVANGDANVRLVNDRFAVLGTFRAQSELAGGIRDARQSALSGDIGVWTPWGLAIGTTKHLDSERPGTVFSSLSGLATPGAALKFDYRTVGLQKTLGDLTLNVNYREAESSKRTTASQPYARDSYHSMWMAESRYDHGPWTGGLGWSTVYRDSVNNPAVEPFEDVFGQGRTNLAHAYLVHRWNPTRSIRLISGAVLTRVDDVTRVRVNAELAIKLAGDRYLRLGIKPTMNRVGTVLFPEDLRARPLDVNSIDHIFASAMDGSHSANTFQARGSSIHSYASAMLVQTPQSQIGIQAFQTQLHKALFYSGNAQVQSSLSLTPVTRGRVMGVTAAASQRLGSGLRVTLDATLQTSRATYQSTLLESRLPNVPNFHSTFTVGADVGDLSAALSVSYVGPRIQAFSEGGAKAPSITRLRGVWGADFSLTMPLGDGTIQFAATNILRSSFYSGFSPQRSFVLAYRSRF